MTSAAGDGVMEIARITITKNLVGELGEPSIGVEFDPEELPLIESLGMLAFAQHSIAIAAMPADDEGD